MIGTIIKLLLSYKGGVKNNHKKENT